MVRDGAETGQLGVGGLPRNWPHSGFKAALPEGASLAFATAPSQVESKVGLFQVSKILARLVPLPESPAGRP